MKQAEPCSQQEAVDHQIERSLRGGPCSTAVNVVDLPGIATFPGIQFVGGRRRADDGAPLE